jgi:hypothetical protein
MVTHSKSIVLKAVVADFESSTNIGYSIGIFWLNKQRLQNFSQKVPSSVLRLRRKFILLGKQLHFLSPK